MLIRSDNKGKFINTDTCGTIYLDGVQNIILVKCDAQVIGKYFSEKKAMEVLDMIEVAYKNGDKIFQMPSDELSEDEIKIYKQMYMNSRGE